jgi:1,4-dihydroxy-2-naphthoyl-CoA hydrolase
MKHIKTIHLNDTDAAGVVYFASLLSLCHEVYEDSLLLAKINIKSFLGSGELALPIVHAEIDFKKPIFCGDKIDIYLSPEVLSETSFAVNYQVCFSDTLITTATAKTIHVCIDFLDKKSRTLPKSLLSWIGKS